MSESITPRVKECGSESSGVRASQRVSDPQEAHEAHLEVGEPSYVAISENSWEEERRKRGLLSINSVFSSTDPATCSAIALVMVRSRCACCCCCSSAWTKALTAPRMGGIGGVLGGTGGALHSASACASASAWCASTSSAAERPAASPSSIALVRPMPVRSARNSSTRASVLSCGSSSAGSGAPKENHLSHRNITTSQLTPCCRHFQMLAF